MKTIKKKGNIKKETFKCLICGCRYESDEYKLHEEIYKTEKKSNIKIEDECPECISKVYKKI
jgi:rubredoxin